MYSKMVLAVAYPIAEFPLKNGYSSDFPKLYGMDCFESSAINSNAFTAFSSVTYAFVRSSEISGASACLRKVI